MTFQKTALLIGASRGIGLEFARQLTASGYNLIATVRDATKAPELAALKARVLKADVADYASLKAMKAELGETPLDLVIFNSGVFLRDSATDLEPEVFEKTFAVNTIGPAVLAPLVVPNLLASKAKVPKYVVVSSRMGSMADNGSGGHYSYRSSKAAVNAIIRSFAVDYKDKIAFLAIHPGYVKTEMTGGLGNIEPTESARNMLQTIEGLSFERSGDFTTNTGEVIPY